MSNIVNIPPKENEILDQLTAKYPDSYGEFLTALKGERDYQEEVWNESTTEKKDFYTLPEWAVFIYEYTNAARAHMSRNPEPHASKMAADCLRKVAAMILDAAEQHEFTDYLLELTADDVLNDIQTINELFCYLQHPINKISEFYYNGASRDSKAFETMFGQIFIAIVDTVSKTDNVVHRNPT